METRQRRSFADDYKRQAVDLVASSDRSIGSVAKELGLRDSVLRRWVELRGREPTAAPRRPTTQATLPSADHAAEIARLQRENDRLRMERDILKNCPAPWRACAGCRSRSSSSEVHAFAFLDFFVSVSPGPGHLKASNEPGVSLWFAR
jgi:transposase